MSFVKDGELEKPVIECEGSVHESKLEAIEPSKANVYACSSRLISSRLSVDYDTRLQN